MTDITAGLLAQQQADFIREGAVPAAVRRERLQRCIDLLVDYRDPLCEALQQDFGGRHAAFSLYYDILGSLGKLKFARDKVKKWSKPERRSGVLPFNLFGAKSWVEYQPKGCVGVMGTWNAPLFTLFAPLAGILAAGNRAILKPSDMTPATAKVVSEAVAKYFDVTEVTVVVGDVEVAKSFASQPFDHLVFTGSTEVGKSIMRSAADNLVPVTLELGGKSPVVIDESADIKAVAEAICAGKSCNSGQVCVSPDHVYLPAAKLQDFIDSISRVYADLYPDISGNLDLTSVINERHRQRLKSYLEDAQIRGARVETCSPRGVDWQDEARRLPLQLVINPDDDSLIMQHEIFGPLLVLLTFEKMDEVVADIQRRPRPLALYYFGHNKQKERALLDQVISGGVTLNDVMMHPALNDAPFGGVGASGLGHYNGIEGFKAFSHVRSFYRAGWYNPSKLIGFRPPYTEKFLQQMKKAVKP